MSTLQMADDIDPVGIQFPTLRSDLAFSTIVADKDSDLIVIKDPASDKYFHIGSNTFKLLRLCNGERSIEEIANAFYDSKVPAAGVEAMKALLGLVAKAGLLTSSTAATGWSRDNARLLRKIVHIKVKAFNPDKLLARTMSLVRPLFSRQFVIAGLAVMALALYLFWKHFGEFSNVLRHADTSIFLVGWLVCLMIAILHELAHGYACKYWGGTVKEMGILFIYFNPALYCNVSDAWLFSKRSQRVWTMAAGGFMEAFLWSCMVIAWTCLARHERLQQVCSVIVLIICFRMTANMIPLIRLDGYYILSDLLKLPNLRRRALRYTFLRLRKIVHPQTVLPNARTKEKISYIVYCLLAVPFSVALALTTVWMSAIAMIHGHWRAGLVLIVISVLMTLEASINPCVKAYAKWMQKGRLDAEQGRVDASQAQ